MFRRISIVGMVRSFVQKLGESGSEATDVEDWGALMDGADVHVLPGRKEMMLCWPRDSRGILAVFFGGDVASERIRFSDTASLRQYLRSHGLAGLIRCELSGPQMAREHFFLRGMSYDDVGRVLASPCVSLSARGLTLRRSQDREFYEYGRRPLDLPVKSVQRDDVMMVLIASLAQECSDISSRGFELDEVTLGENKAYFRTVPLQYANAPISEFMRHLVGSFINAEGESAFILRGGRGATGERVYELMAPEDVGVRRHAFSSVGEARDLLESLGYSSKPLRGDSRSMANEVCLRGVNRNRPFDAWSFRHRTAERLVGLF